MGVLRKHKRREPIVLSQMRPMTLLFVLCGCILFTFCLIHISGVAGFFGKIFSALGPVFTGFLFAYLLNPVAVWLEKRFNRLFSRTIKKHPGFAHFTRGLSAFLTVLVFVGLLTLLVFSVSSQLLNGISAFLDQLPGYVNSVTSRFEEMLKQDTPFARFLRDLTERFNATDLAMGKLDTAEFSTKILETLATGAKGTFFFLYDVIVGFVIAVYVLISKERFIKQFKQLLYALVKTKTADWITKQMRSASKTFGTAVLGKFVDSIVIGMLCFIGNTILDIPYASLIAVIVGITNMIPFFGPIIGAIPCVLLILMENPLRALYFTVFIIALQQFDVNILDPRIVGSSIGLPAFWELFACLLGGGMFGFPGMVLGVPAFAIIYKVIRQLVGERLKERVRTGEITSDFVKNYLGITEEIEDSGLLESTEMFASSFNDEYYYAGEEAAESTYLSAAPEEFTE